MLYGMKSRLAFIVLFFLLSLGISAQDVPDPIYPYRLVNDFANIFSAAEKQALEQRLLAYNDSTSTQIYVVAVNDLGGYPASALPAGGVGGVNWHFEDGDWIRTMDVTGEPEFSLFF